MATVLITVKDGEDNEVSVTMEFDPVVARDESGTPAQHAAVEMVEYLREKNADSITSESTEEV